ncbi:MAG: amidohydrolase, partial [Synergistaceae bacterium]|nr:amidohydrolase [Synergistaceae bacterium]
MDNKDIEQIKSTAAGMAEDLTALRRYLHAHPEVSWQEVETSRLIASKLEEIGLNPRIGSGGKPVGVVADLDCGKGGKNPCVALRADIDALGFSEENDIGYKSLNPGAMHACGHDRHIAMLLGAAKILYSMRDRIRGRVRFKLQPAEEFGAGSGAQVMVKEGVLEGVDAIAGMHLWSHVPSGRVQWRCGPVMGTSDDWEVCFRGKGGHGAMPHQTITPPSSRLTSSWPFRASSAGRPILLKPALSARASSTPERSSTSFRRRRNCAATFGRSTPTSAPKSLSC